jgi:hypothetical protein
VASQQERSAAYKDRLRHGRIYVPIEVGPTQIRALEKLSLLDAGERDRGAIAWAVERFLDTAEHLVATGNALWPHRDDNDA